GLLRPAGCGRSRTVNRSDAWGEAPAGIEIASFVPAASVGPTSLKVRSSAGAWLSGTVRYMAVTPVSMRRLPQAAGFAPLTEMQAGAPGPVSLVRRRGKLDIGEVPARAGCGQPDVHASPGHDIAAPHALSIGGIALERGDVQERVFLGPALRLVIMAAAESDPQHRNP